MNSKWQLHTFLLLFLVILNLEAARILGIFAHNGKSHFDAFKPLMVALSKRGHDVVVASHFPQKISLTNYTDISLEGSAENNGTKAVTLEIIDKLSQWIISPMLTSFGQKNCEAVFQYPPIQILLKSDEKFDLLISELFNTDCYLGFVHKFKVPHISLSSHVLMPWANGRVGNPDNPGYIPHLFSLEPHKMNLLQRIMNTVSLLYHKLVYSLLASRWNQAIISEWFAGSPALDDIRRNTSLILVNSHFSVNGARPLVPGVVEVEGLHIRQPKKLPEDLDKFISEAKHGVVYFSMGSMIRAETFPEEKRRAFLEAFSELPQRVLWKWEGGELPDQPSNVLTKEWMPQNDILSHTKVLAYMSHCGNLGSLEAASAGVPVVGLPMYGDQFNNARSLEQAGMAVILRYGDVTKSTVLQALRAVLDHPSYQENAKRVSRAFNDRPLSPLDTAVYWTEYVIRHRGAPHMRTAAVDMPWYQYLLLDVIAVLSIGACASFYISYLVLATVYNLMPSATSKSNKRKNKHIKKH